MISFIKLFFALFATWELALVVRAVFAHGIWMLDNHGINVLQSLILVVAFFICCSAMLLLRFLRVYVLLMEEKVPKGELFVICLKTTFVNLFVPWKLGEVYRILSYSQPLGSLTKGTLIVLMDRFFDIIPLVLGFIVLYLIWGEMSGLDVYLLFYVSVFCLFIGICLYLAFPSTYTYLNESFLNRKESGTNNNILIILRELNKLYGIIINMVRSRGWLLFFVSIVAWVCEMLSIWIISLLTLSNSDAVVSPQDFLYQYLNTQIDGAEIIFFLIYKFSCVPVLLILSCLYFYSIKKGNAK